MRHRTLIAAALAGCCLLASLPAAAQPAAGTLRIRLNADIRS
jgi:hypothetical protein